MALLRRGRPEIHPPEPGGTAVGGTEIPTHEQRDQHPVNRALERRAGEGLSSSTAKIGVIEQTTSVIHASCRAGDECDFASRRMRYDLRLHGRAMKHCSCVRWCAARRPSAACPTPGDGSERSCGSPRAVPLLVIVPTAWCRTHPPRSRPSDHVYGSAWQLRSPLRAPPDPPRRGSTGRCVAGREAERHRRPMSKAQVLAGTFAQKVLRRAGAGPRDGRLVLGHGLSMTTAAPISI
jgi:hypothetical protein